MEAVGAKLNGPGHSYRSRLPNGLVVRCNLADHVERQIYFQGAYEPIESFIFCRLIQPGMVVIDGGANVGQYSLLASTGVGPTGSVHAFEPIPGNFERLTENLRANGVSNVHANLTALWHEPTSLEFGLAADLLDNAGSYTVGVESAVPTVTAQAIRLDDYAAEHDFRRVDLVKLDVEGAELFALRGMTQILTRYRPSLLIEVTQGGSARMGYSTDDLWSFLVKQQGYRAWKIGLSAAAWEEMATPLGITQSNILFTPGDLPATLTSEWTVRSCIRWAGTGR